MVKLQSDSTSYYKSKYNEQLNLTDSLHDELFNEKVQNGRYELGLDFLKEKRPNEYNLIMHFIETQTE